MEMAGEEKIGEGEEIIKYNMNQTSTLQQQFPLSPKKFWKKVIEKVAALYVLAFVMLVVITILAQDVIIWGIFIAGLIFLVIITLLYSWYVRVYIRRYYYSGEESFITIKKGVFAPTEIHVQWQKIQDVYVDQDILDRIMGLYDVHIASATASSGIEAHIDGVDEKAAEGLKKFFLDKISNRGTQNNNQASTEDQVKQPTQSPIKINLSEEISSNVYPLSTKWTVVTLLERIIGALIYPGIFLLIISGKVSKVKMTDDLKYYILIWTAISILTIVVRIITLFLWKKNYAFSFNSDNIYFKEGVISLSEKHMPYSSIQDVTVNQGVIDRIVGLAKVRIENAATQSIMTKNGLKPVFTGVMIQGLSIADANKVTDILKTTVLGRNTSKYGL